MAEQTIEKQEIVVVWFKRDLRFTDHEALYHAQNYFDSLDVNQL